MVCCEEKKYTEGVERWKDGKFERWKIVIMERWKK
jgi:hypothetical protein